MQKKNYHTNLIAIQTKFELLKLFRMPAYIITLVGLPLFFYMATGTNQKMPQLTEGILTPKYLIATLGTFGVFGICLFGFGVNYAIERSQGWYHTLQPAPISLTTVFLSKVAACLLLSSIAVILLFLEAHYIFNVQMEWWQWLSIFTTLLLGALPLASLGLFIGSLFGSNSVSIVTIMVYLAIASVSGLLATLTMIKKGNPNLAEMAVIYPTYHIYQLALACFKPISINNILIHISVLIGYSVIFLALVAFLFKQNFKKSYG